MPKNKTLEQMNRQAVWGKEGLIQFCKTILPQLAYM